MTDQPEALRLAELIRSRYGNYLLDKAAAELRRLHAENEALRAALEAALDFAGTVGPGASWWDDIWPEHQAALDAARDKP